MPNYEAFVTAAGPEADGSVKINLNEGKDGGMSGWFIAHSRVQKEMLATALAALVSQRKVQATFIETPPVSDKSVIQKLFVF